MTVGVAQNRIDRMEDTAKKLGEFLFLLSEERAKTLEADYGITYTLLQDAYTFLSLTAKNCQEKLDNCEVECECFW